MIKLDLSYLGKKIDWAAYQEKVSAIHESINKKTGAGSDFLGWADYPLTYDKEELKRILEDADYIRHHFDVLVVCGIGGSYLGARAAIDAIKGLYPDEKPEIIYMGQTVAPSYIHQVLKYLKGKKFAINCISKSGTTTETAIGFRLLRNLLLSQVGEEGAKKAIYVTTDAKKGALLTLSQKYGYARYVLPSDVGGRYSVFTAVGLLPMAVAGIDVKGFLKGALDSRHDYGSDKL
ncbi:MAG: glucose-6-phosphate isomerase, partial [Bacilli bacterium]|nr:glucose-6-phosphate isomerase [Bacilli bacterium]